jgi:hypothetical protein
MPADPLTAAIVSSILSSAVQGLLTSPPPQPPTGMMRTLPMEAKRGLMSPPLNGMVRIDGRYLQLSPGAVMRNEFNMVIPPMMLQAPAWVRYQTDAMGAVYRVWILSTAEAAFADPRHP